MKSNKFIGITLGDIAGVGPEITAKALNSPDISKDFIYVVFGDIDIFNKASKLIKNFSPKVGYCFASEIFPDLFKKTEIKFNKSNIGKISKEFGRLSIQWITESVKAYKLGLISALVTAPINKESCKLSGFKFQGHTDYIADLLGNPLHRMAFYSDKLKLVLVTHHESLNSVLKNLNQKDVYETIKIANDFMHKLGFKKPKILVSGINPHASENGQFGLEESKIIQPVILKSQKNGINALGPFPPDTIFLQALKYPNSIIVSMTHDLGLAPFKVLYFDQGVNISIGLPLIRTSPDHGTAYDIAWKNTVSPSSMISAINLAAKMIYYCGD